MKKCLSTTYCPYPKILEGSVQPGSTITVDTENGELVLR